MEDADVVGMAGIPGEGPFMVMAVKLEGETLTDLRYETYGCPSAIASGSWVTEWAKGKTREQAQSLEPGELMLMLGGLPLGKEHAAQLAVTALRSALAQVAEKDAEAG